MLAILLSLVAPPPPLPVEALASDDPAVWRQASDDLWHAGGRAVPALREAMRHPDPDVRLRAALVLSRLARGIRPGTPPGLIAQIERYRDGDAAQRRDAVAALAKEGAPGYAALRLVLARETDAAARKALADSLKALARPAARDHIRRGELDEAEAVLEAAAGSDE